MIDYINGSTLFWLVLCFVLVIVFVTRSDNVVQLYDRHGQQIQDIPLPGYDVILYTSRSYIHTYLHTDHTPDMRNFTHIVALVAVSVLLSV